MNSINQTARVTGLVYLLLVPLSFLSLLVVTRDPTTAASNIRASEPLFRLGIVATLLVQLVNVIVVLALYELLKSVNAKMALLMVIFLLLGVPIAMLNEVNQFAVLVLIGAPDYLTVFTADQLRALVPLFLRLHEQGINIAGIFWGLWLFPMGYLVFKSGFLPRILGVLLIVAGFGYLIDSFAAFLVPDYGFKVAALTFWGEVFLALWLLIKGVNVERWKKRALATA